MIGLGAAADQSATELDPACTVCGVVRHSRGVAEVTRRSSMGTTPVVDDRAERTPRLGLDEQNLCLRQNYPTGC